MYIHVCVSVYICIYAHVFGVKPQYVTGIPTKMGDWIDHKAEKKVNMTINYGTNQWFPTSGKSVERN